MVDFGLHLVLILSPRWTKKLYKKGSKTYHKKETLKKKKKAGEDVLEKLDGQALMAGEELRLNLDPRSKIDNEIIKYTKGRPVTPSIVTKLTGTKLHEWFELQIIEEENEALKPHEDADNDEEQREHAAMGPLGDLPGT